MDLLFSPPGSCDDDDVEAPLLPRSGTWGEPQRAPCGRDRQKPAQQQRQQQQQQRQQQQQQHQQQQQQQQQQGAGAGAPVDLGPLFARRLWRLLRLVRAAPALLLVLMCVGETLLVSKIGTISGMFYQVFVDGDASRVPPLMAWSAGCYTATALFYALKSATQDFFAWRWRAALTLHLQQLYCSSIGARCAATHAPLLQALDAPDQRIAQDLPLLTASLAEVLSQLAAVPLNLVVYACLTRQVFGSWLPVGVAGAFFLAGLALQRAAMLPVAAAVFGQEAAEGGLRYSHMRLRAWWHEVALSRSQACEEAHLRQQLCRVLVCQGRLLLRRALLAASSRLLEYGGLVVNFGCLAAAVFGGAWADEQRSAGGLAARVSVASFYLLTLMYNLSQVLDLAGKVSSLAGLTARVSQLLEALADGAAGATTNNAHTTTTSSSSSWVGAAGAGGAGHAPGGNEDPGQAPDASPKQQQRRQQQALVLVGDGMAPSHKRYASQAVVLEPPQLMLVKHGNCGCQQQQHRDACAAAAAAAAAGAIQAAGVPAAPPCCCCCCCEAMQVSVHSMGSDMLLQQVRGAFPDAPRLAPLLAVVTFQFCGSARGTMLRRALRQQQQQQQQQHAAGEAPACLPDCYVCGSSGSGSRGSGRGHGTVAPGAAAHAADVDAPPCCGACAGEPSSSCPGDAGVCSGADMQHMLEVFLGWQSAVSTHIQRSGAWCGAVDPRTGRALAGAPGSSYDEVIGASVLLGYAKHQQGQGQGQQALPLISHPEAHTQVYPATLFTTAPLPVVRAALQAAAHACGLAPRAQPATPISAPPAAGSAGSASNSSSSSSSSSSGNSSDASCCAPGNALSAAAAGPLAGGGGSGHSAAPPCCEPPLLLSCTGLSVSTPTRAAVATGLSLSVPAGGSLLVQGPSGCGKSTLLSCLAGLWPADAGHFSIAAAAAAAAPSPRREHAGAVSGAWSCGGVMFLPQRPLAAPGGSFREQLLYPAAAAASAQDGGQAPRWWACSCGAAPQHAPQQEGHALLPGQAVAGRHQRQQQQEQRQRRGRRQPGGGASAGAGSSAWWRAWLSCGLECSRRPAGAAPQGAAAWKQQQQQQQQQERAPPPCASCQLLHQAVEAVGLGYLLPALPRGLATRAEDWAAVLSPGEMQRVAFARLLLHRPLLAVLDEATSSLPDAASVELYAQLRAAGVSYVSVGHGSCLPRLHHQVLRLAGDGSGGWQLAAAARGDA